MLKLRRPIALAVLASMLFAAACNNTGGGITDTEDTSAGISDTTETTVKEKEWEYYENLDGLDFGGEYEFTILSYGGDAWKLYLDADEASNELLSNAAFKRNTEVEEMLGVKITEHLANLSEYENLFKNTVLAGDGESFDLLAFYSPGQRATYITENLVYDWQSVPYINLDAPWYNQSANDNFTIAGKQYFGVSDITFAGQQNASVLFNPIIVEEYKLDSPYELVREGKWTLDAFRSYIKNTYVDVDNNSVKDENDKYGIVSHVNVFGRIMASTGSIEVTMNEEGFNINMFSDKIVDTFERVRELAVSSDVFKTSNANLPLQSFMNGNCMFCLYASDPAKLRDVEFDFGYLPFPKYDEAQESYITEAAGGMMAIPQNAPNIERTGAIIEALSAGSAKYITDAFVESYIEGKVLRSDDDVEMYRLCRDTYTYNVSYNIDPADLLASHKYYSTMLNNPSLEIASYYESIKTQVTKAYDSLWEIAKGND
ncbi:MAG: hypothetical protein IJ428_05615 [Clostridia bacterium]|nr:hypothetical protein [Clostridia bacterium]